MILEGSLSVKAAILGKRRNVTCVYVDEKKKDKDVSFILAKAYESSIEVKKCSRDQIDAMSSGKTHGGILCEAEERQYQEIDSIFTDQSFIAVLEGIEDPFNLGYALRTLYSAGCTGVLLRKRDWSNVESIIVKSSAGASEYCNIVLSENLAKDILECKNRGCTCYAAMRKDAVPYFSCDFDNSILIAIGGEMRGLSKDVLEAIGTNIYIPYENDFRNALNASSAIAALSFEVVRQRKFK